MDETVRKLLSWGIVVVSRGLAVPGAVRLHMADGVPLLQPEDQVFQVMLDGWRNQHLARNLARSTVEGREATVKAFADYVSAYPWAWSPAMVDEWLGCLPAFRDATLFRAAYAFGLRSGLRSDGSTRFRSWVAGRALTSTARSLGRCWRPIYLHIGP
ncbi:hypothetical protein EAS64_02505 [Trebonia kvetii]|uniref:Uncharacterized protein n=1 Tax=Trebonia kvetii TaxID=2480626 RepID=A0A6P2C571_9ACTN|nr:hypothetical protein [Trebonia kvetii]TVZ06320.1 hypothetical protein EAS64_02505 [Trebonia kvetii]